jgi:hypothetical protein
MNDSLSVSSIDNKLKIGYESSNKILLNNNQSSIMQSETRENTKISELKEETVPYKFLWKEGGNNVKISGTFLDNWEKVLEMKKIINTDIFEIIINLTKSKHEFKFIVDDKWLCSQQYATIKNKNDFNNIIDLTNYSQEENDFNNINDKINKTLKKCSKDYGCKYFRESDFERDVPSIPLFFVKNFNLNSKYIQKRAKMISRSFLNFNLSKNILENNEYKTILTFSHEKLSHICYKTNGEYNNNEDKYIKSSVTQRNNHKFLTLIYFTPKK